MKEKYGSQSKPSAQRPSRWHFILIALSPPTTAKQIYILKRKMSAGRWLEKEGREGEGESIPGKNSWFTSQAQVIILPRKSTGFC